MVSGSYDKCNKDFNLVHVQLGFRVAIQSLMEDTGRFGSVSQLVAFFYPKSFPFPIMLCHMIAQPTFCCSSFVSLEWPLVLDGNQNKAMVM